VKWLLPAGQGRKGPKPKASSDVN